MNKKKMLAALALVGSLSLVTACGSGGDEEAAGSSQAPSSQSGGSEQAAAPEPDLNGIPDVVATVNGQDITKDEFASVYKSQFQQAAMQAQMSGQDISDQTELKKQAAEAMVGSELLMQRAEQTGMKASKADMDKALAAAAKTNQMSSKEFLAALEKQGMDRKTVDEQLKQQVEVEGVIKKELGTFDASEKELKAAYQQAKEAQSQQGGSAAAMPKYADVKSQLKKQVVQQKENQATATLVEKLKKEGDVKVNL